MVVVVVVNRPWKRLGARDFALFRLVCNGSGGACDSLSKWTDQCCATGEAARKRRATARRSPQPISDVWTAPFQFPPDKWGAAPSVPVGKDRYNLYANAHTNQNNLEREACDASFVLDFVDDCTKPPPSPSPFGMFSAGAVAHFSSFRLIMKGQKSELGKRSYEKNEMSGWKQRSVQLLLDIRLFLCVCVLFPITWAAPIVWYAVKLFSWQRLVYDAF